MVVSLWSSPIHDPVQNLVHGPVQSPVYGPVQCSIQVLSRSPKVLFEAIAILYQYYIANSFPVTKLREAITLASLWQLILYTFNYMEKDHSTHSA